MAALVIDSSSFRRAFVEVYISALPGMRKELEWNSHDYSPLLSISPRAELFSRKTMPYSDLTDFIEYLICAGP